MGGYYGQGDYGQGVGDASGGWGGGVIAPVYQVILLVFDYIYFILRFEPFNDGWGG